MNVRARSAAGLSQSTLPVAVHEGTAESPDKPRELAREHFLAPPGLEDRVLHDAGRLCAARHAYHLLQRGRRRRRADALHVIHVRVEHLEVDVERDGP